MHNYHLHRPVTAKCLCCHVGTEFTFTARSDHVICKGCVRHQGDTLAKAKQRDTDHVALWRSELDLAMEHHAEEIARLLDVISQRDQELATQRIEIQDLQAVVRTGVESAPLGTVQHWWVDEQIANAVDQRDSAYRSRDHAYRALWAVDELHHEDDARDRYCSCGRRVDQCKVFDAIAPAVNALRKWEKNQMDRLHRDLPHGLPDEHPEVLKQCGSSRHRIRHRPAG